MAIDDADGSDAEEFSDVEASPPSSDEQRSHGPTRDSAIRVGEYTWADFMEEYGYASEVSTLYPHGTHGPDDQLGLDTDEEARSTVPKGSDWERVDFDPSRFLGYDPDELPELIRTVFAPNHDVLESAFLEYVDPSTTPVVKDVYTWEHYKWEYYYEDDGRRPRDDQGEIEHFDDEAALGFDSDTIEQRLFEGGNAAMELDELVQERTVDVEEDFDEDGFFSTDDGHTTVVNRYDLEKAVPLAKKQYFKEVERYWVNKPYAFVVIFHSEKENEKKYYVIEPYFNEIERELQDFLSGKLRTAIKYSDDGIKQKANEDGRRQVIENETRRLLKRYDLFERTSNENTLGILETVRTLLDDDDEARDEATAAKLEGIEVRPEPIVLEEDSDTLNEYQVEKLLYQLKRNFIGYERIDGIKHDINVEDISVDGYNSPVFVYHSGYEQIISNVYHGEDELDDFVVKLAQRSGKGISKRLPQVDATLPDGSRAQLTLGTEVSDHGTNYTIRQFKDVPFTPIDLINWNTFSLDEMAFLWLCIENHKSLIFAGGTASGKTTSLNAVSLFIPSNTKIVSIEDTREVELPQRNWIASVTRPSFSDDAQGDINEFDLLEAALRQRPDYIVMGEIRGEEGRTLFQVMSTGHTTYTTFHADSVDEVLKRFTTDPINVSKTMFTALDLVSIQTQTRVQGSKVRRNKSLTEINHYEAEHDEINVQDVYQWQAETDEYLKMGDSNTLDEIQFDRGWNYEKLQSELFKRQIILAYLIKNGLNTYAQVAATVQAFINDPDTILTLIANGQLEESLEDLREMESVLIDVDPEKEELVPRPDASNETYNLSMDILERAEESLFEEYRGKVPSGLASALGDVEQADPITVGGSDPESFEFGGEIDDELDDEWGTDDESSEFTFETGEGAESPSWLDEDGEFDSDTGSGTGQTASADADTATPSRAPTASPEATDAEPAATDRPELEAGAGKTESVDQDAGTVDASGQDLDVDQSGGVPELESGPSADATPGQLEDAQTPELEGAQTSELSADDSDSPDPSPTEGGTETSAESERSDTSGGGFTDLFSDMESALEDIESADRDDGPASGDGAAGSESDSGFDFETDPEGRPAGEDEVDTSEFDSMFPHRDLETLFGSQPSSDEATSRSEASPDGTADDGESIFGTQSDSVFTTDEREIEDRSDSHFDEDGSNSIFGDEGTSVFDDDGSGDGSVDERDDVFDEQDESTEPTAAEDDGGEEDE